MEIATYIIALATSLAALFTGLGWWTTRYGLRPLVEAQLSQQLEKPHYVTVTLRVRNRRPFSLVIFRVELVRPKAGVTLFSHPPETAGAVQVRQRVITFSQRIDAHSAAGVQVCAVLDDDKDGYDGPLWLSVKTFAPGAKLKTRSSRVKRAIRLERGQAAKRRVVSVPAERRQQRA